MKSEDDLWPVLDQPSRNLGSLWRNQCGWRGRDLTPSDWTVALPPGLAAEIVELAAAADAANTSAPDIARTWCPSSLAAEVQTRVEELLEGGLGFCVVKGLPPTGHDGIDATAILLLSLLFGRPVSQTRRGNFIGRVEDLGFDAKDPKTRGHQSAAELAFHCDRADRIVLYCIRTALTGGHSRLFSTMLAAEILAAEHPRFAERLFGEIPQDMRSEPMANAAWCALPVFARQDGAFVGRYLRRFIGDSQQHGDAPRLDETTLAALACLDEILARPGLALEMQFAPGDIQVLNNNVVLHARTAFVDSEARNARRLLLRVWLSHRSARALPASFRVLYGPTAAGSYRGGVWPPGMALADRAAVGA